MYLQILLLYFFLFLSFSKIKKNLFRVKILVFLDAIENYWEFITFDRPQRFQNQQRQNVRYHIILVTIR